MPGTTTPRTFFLNESHEHARGEKEGGGKVARYTAIDWRDKGQRIATSLKSARTTIRNTPDPSREAHLFLVSTVEEQVEKPSTDKRKAKDGRVVEESNIAGEHALIFQRLGLDLLAVTDGGEALVHVEDELLDKLLATAAKLDSARPRERARWVFLSDFRPAPAETRADPEWIASLPLDSATEAIIEIQPLLRRTEVEAMAQVLRVTLAADERQQVMAAGRDFSGRSWFRVRLLRATVEMLAREFQSIQSIHSPLRSVLMAPLTNPVAGAKQAPPLLPVATNLPAVAIIDTGVPRQHPWLGPYLRGQHFHAEADTEQAGLDDHPSRVASRIVFGDVQVGPGFVPPPGRCQYLDVVVPAERGSIGDAPTTYLDGKAIQDVTSAVARSYPDIRVFDFSFGSYEPLGSLEGCHLRERLVELQDLDNLIFANDLLVVVAAGNSPPGAVPNEPYPGHLDDPLWGLGASAAGFNTLIVGSHVGTPTPGGVAGHTGWPSPFTRVGPGIARAPVPGFSASGGDAPSNYSLSPFRPGMGVWTCGRTGIWEDAPGTSFSAPIVAREAAILLQRLQQHCAPGVKSFAATAKAFLHLVARRIGDEPPPRVRRLADRTLGKGLPRSDRIGRPDGSSAVLIWQGTLDSAGSIARVRVPVPAAWMKQAKCPGLRIVCAWNTPVSAAAPKAWASRNVTMRLKPTLGAHAIPGKGRSHGVYPITDRTWRLDCDRHGKPRPAPSDGEWIVEIFYEDAGPYPRTLQIPPQQKVALVMELFDDSPDPVSPQDSLQALPIADTMIQLAGVPHGIQIPVKVRV